MTSSLDFEGELILDGVLLDKLETLTKKLQKATKKTDKATILLDAKNEIGENPLFFSSLISFSIRRSQQGSLRPRSTKGANRG